LSTLNIPAPAKVNLFLAVTGRRTDGFHDLLSVAAPLTWGDSLEVEAADSGFALACDHPEVPGGDDNLVLKAARAFAAATGWTGGARFTLRKRIPFGAGLGGASSNATAALRALNALAGEPLDAGGLARVASSVGSDCALFLPAVPVIMRGRGELVQALPKEPYSRIRGMRVLVFKPGFMVPTPWAYARLVEEAPRGYVRPRAAEAQLSAWTETPGAPAEGLLFNSMERAVFSKYPALPVMLEHLANRFGIYGRMSGSGSACFALLHEAMEAPPIESAIREAWGPSTFVVESRIA
jgi:4-diphosphocytidyl-2-C-methyl-D-erythritol kinase